MLNQTILLEWARSRIGQQLLHLGCCLGGYFLEVVEARYWSHLDWNCSDWLLNLEYFRIVNEALFGAMLRLVLLYIKLTHLLVVSILNWWISFPAVFGPRFPLFSGFAFDLLQIIGGKLLGILTFRFVHFLIQERRDIWLIVAIVSRAPV